MANNKATTKTKVKQKRGKGVGKGAKKASSAIWSIAFWLFVGLLGFSLLTGSINQRKTGESLVQYYVNSSHKISNFLSGNSETPLQGTGLHMTEDGIYLEGYDTTEDSVIENPGAENGAPEITMPVIE